MTRGKSAVVRYLHKNIKATQRLNAENLNITKLDIKNIYNDKYAYFVGLIEGDGWFSVNKKGKYLTYEIGIELNIRDIKLLYKLKKLLGIGIIKIRKRKTINPPLVGIPAKGWHKEIELATFSIRNKKHLKEIIIPIFDKYPMLTLKQYDYINFKKHLLNNIIYSKDLPIYTRSNIPLYDLNYIINQSYFSSWLIGFIEVEGSFGIYKTCKEEILAYFEISQSHDTIILEAIKKYLNISNAVYLNKKINNYKLKITSIRNIENLIKFMNKNPVKLLGYKKIQYILFLKEIRKISKYNININIPDIYK